MSGRGITRTSSAVPFNRPAQLEQLRRRDFDVVVVGGGITGAGVALDAAARGLRVALIERHDFASGTSSKSSKLVHGGLRYLQQGEVGLVYEALHERQRLLRNAPHLVNVLPFLIPMLARGGVINAKLARAVGGAMWAYDLTGGFRVGRLHKRLSGDDALGYMPTLDRGRLASAYLYYDCTADDARLVLTVLRTAALDFGAVVVNQVGATGISRDATGKVRSIEVDADGERIEVSTRAVVNAAGVWSDDIRALDEGANPDSIRPAKGVHVTVPWHLVRNTVAVVVPVPGDRRSVFVVPHGEVTYIGTTDTDYDGPVDAPTCTGEDVDYLLGAINGAIGGSIGRHDILGAWAGLRPLVKSASSGRTADLSRRHKVRVSPSGVITITGGKLTTYREMAADTVDALVDGPLADCGAPRRSPTARLRLRGAHGHAAVLASAADHPTGEDVVRHLAGRYGGETTTLLGMIRDRPELGERLVDGQPYVAAEAVFAARFEMANSVDDVLARRTRSLIFARDAADAAAHTTAGLLAPELGWSPADRSESAEAFRVVAAADRASFDATDTGPADHASADDTADDTADGTAVRTASTS